MIEPLRGAAAWSEAARLGRPVVVVGNGPSAADLPAGAVPEEAVIVRTNAFFFEDTRRYGSRVDGIFWAVARRWLQLGFQAAIAEQAYDFGTFFTPVGVARETLPPFRAEAAELARLLQPRMSHFDLLRAEPIIAGFLAAPRERVRPMLPTQGLQAVATMLAFGFRDIRIAGMDLYQADQRYVHAVPDFIRDMTAPVHLSGGYEAAQHGLETDLGFLTALRVAFPLARISCLSPSSYTARLLPLAPVSARAAASAGPVPAGFESRLRMLCGAPFGPVPAAPQPEAEAAGLAGGVAQLDARRALLWAWRPEQPTAWRSVLIEGASGLRERLRPDQKVHELELACLGDGRHGRILDLAWLAERVGPPPWRFTDVTSGLPLHGSPLDPREALRWPRPDPREIRLVTDPAAPASAEASGDVVAMPDGEGRLRCDIKDGPTRMLRPARPDLAGQVAALRHSFPGVPIRWQPAPGALTPAALAALAQEIGPRLGDLLAMAAEGMLIGLPVPAQDQIKAALMLQTTLFILGEGHPRDGFGGLLDRVPAAQRLPLSVGIGLLDMLGETPGGAALLIGLPELLQAGEMLMPRLLAMARAGEKQVFVSVPCWPAGGARARDLLHRLGAAGGTAIATDLGVADALRAALPGLPLRVAEAPPATWRAIYPRPARPDGRRSIGLLVAEADRATLDLVADAVWALPAEARQRLDLLVLPLGGQAGPAEAEAAGIASTDAVPVANPSAEVMAALDAGILMGSASGFPPALSHAAALDLPLLLAQPAGFAAQGTAPPVLGLDAALAAALAGHGEAGALQAPATEGSTAALLAAIADVPRHAAAAFLTGQDSLAAASPTEDDAADLEIRAYLGTSGEGSTVTLRLFNRSPHAWVRAGRSGRGATHLDVAFHSNEPGHSNEQGTTLVRHTLPLLADLPPGSEWAADFPMPKGLAGRSCTFTLSLLRGAMGRRRLFGPVQIRRAP
ncbi:hypothetical protein HB662_28215 [Roseomonas frigidaquae]|uniref:Uncharacterized protein n=1 Tax=Falsiroseomonas frigidaquae TaxID=487318 RepID=A0ABX1F8Q9_9PROT|nr:hypothetical protein [Falsiroseomonas frigidaquae]NKE48683.1 hypothetical protein [Falsiroseomonas frigidaquae]